MIAAATHRAAIILHTFDIIRRLSSKSKNIQSREFVACGNRPSDDIGALSSTQKIVGPQRDSNSLALVFTLSATRGTSIHGAGTSRLAPELV